MTKLNRILFQTGMHRRDRDELGKLPVYRSLECENGDGRRGIFLCLAKFVNMSHHILTLDTEETKGLRVNDVKSSGSEIVDIVAGDCYLFLFAVPPSSSYVGMGHCLGPVYSVSEHRFL